MITDPISVEGVHYWRFVVRYRLSDGRRRRLVRWSPGYPWVREEICRELADRFGLNGIWPKSVTIKQA